MTTSHDTLQQGIAAARSGQRALARQLLVRAIEVDQYNDEAWVWLAGVVDDPADMRRCLQQALRINPLNPQARQGIAWLDQQARQAQKTSSSTGAPPGGQVSSASPSATTHPLPSQAANPPSSAPSATKGGLFQLPSATNSSSSASQSDASVSLATTHPLPSQAANPPSPTPSATKGGLFQLPPAPHSAAGASAAPASNRPSEAPRPVDQPVRRFTLFGKPKPTPDAAAPASEASRPVNQPARHFTLFGKPEPAAAAMVATAAAGAAGATMTVPVATPVSKPRRKEKELPPEEGDPTRDRCPYCGELNKPDRKWCRRCDRSLMIRGPVRERRSPWLSVLGILWIIGGVLGILGAVLGLIGLLVLYSSLFGDLSEFPLRIVLVAVIIALIYGGQIALARAMLNRARWAYWITVVLTAPQFCGSLIGTLFALGASALIDDVIAQAQVFLPSSDAAAAAATINGIFRAAVLLDVVIKACSVLLVGLSWRDFYGPKERFVSEVRGTTDHELFNTGLALQRKGMWWMAMKQWEAAVANSPRDTDYLHALTVAYAKLGEWEKARETIAKAISISPNNPILRQIQERIERMTLAAQG